MEHQLNPDDFIADVLKAVNDTTGYLFSYVRSETLAAAQGKVNDSPGVYLVRGKHPSSDAILKVSNDRFPDSVATEFQKIQIAVSLLSDENAAVVAIPIAEGRVFGQSFAIWPRYRPISDVKILRAIQKRLLYKKVFLWIRGIGIDSINRELDSKTIEQQCRLPVRHIGMNLKLSGRVRSIAEKALKCLDSGQWLPVSILQHSDLYLDNILLPRLGQRQTNKFGFFVIDWGGSYAVGSPGFDLIVFCMSANMPLRRARREVIDYVSALRIKPEEFTFSLIAALGLIGTHLNEFPESRYLALCECTVSYVDSIGLLS